MEYKIVSIKYLDKLVNLEEFYLGEKGNILDGDLNVLYNLYKKFSLRKVIFPNKKNYSHTREDIGYVMPPEVAKAIMPRN